MTTSVLTRPQSTSQGATYQSVAFTNTTLVNLPNIPSSPLVKVILNDISHQAVYNEHQFNEIMFNGDTLLTDSFIKFTHIYDKVNNMLLIGFDENRSGTVVYTY